MPLGLGSAGAGAADLTSSACFSLTSVLPSLAATSHFPPSWAVTVKEKLIWVGVALKSATSMTASSFFSFTLLTRSRLLPVNVRGCACGPGSKLLGLTSVSEMSPSPGLRTFATVFAALCTEFAPK
jgi:hypothetical protein